MNFSRRSFIKSTSILTAGFLLPTNRLLNALQNEPGNMKLLRGNVGIYTERGGTIGWQISDDAIVVVDSQFPDTARNFMSMVIDKTKRKIDFVINTHHHADHTSGNYMLNKITDKIIAHENAVKLQKQFYGKGDTKESQVYANITFSKEWSTTIGKQTITASYLKPAHTSGDVTVHFENENIVHLGDLVFNRVYPYIDRPGGSNISYWIEYLDKITHQFDSDTIFIFGHGSSITGKIEDLIYMRNYLSALLDTVMKEITLGKSQEEIENLNVIPGFENHGGTRIKNNLTAAYEELTS